MTNKQRILLVDDHKVVRLDQKPIRASSNFGVVIEISAAREAVERVVNSLGCWRDGIPPAQRFCVGFQEIADKYPDTKVIMLTSCGDEMLFFHPSWGCWLCSSRLVANLVHAIEAVGRGEPCLTCCHTKGSSGTEQPVKKKPAFLPHSARTMSCSLYQRARQS
jgi:DNA-binding NarL/FixJ family response regulator